MSDTIFKTLEKLNLTSLKSRELFSKQTRDKKVKVWRDKFTEIIYIDENKISSSYTSGNYRKENLAFSNIEFYPHFERHSDTERRFSFLSKFIFNKNLLDFGCGYGEFLKKSKNFAKSVTGIELQRNLINEINTLGIKCYDDLKLIKKESIDTCVLFHSFEHLSDPLNSLKKINSKIVKGGFIIIEVPHARDILLNDYRVQQFKKYSLWSQHLILHTKQSLRSFLLNAGFCEINIIGVQRYPLSNHLNWLIAKEPGGHKKPLSFLDTEGLVLEYENSLSKIDATDTLLLIAKK